VIPKFAIFYANGDIVEGGGEEDELVEITFKISKKWLDAPNDEVQAVVVENPYSCRYVWRGQDYFFVLPVEHEVHAADDIQPFLRKYMKGIVKSGVCLGSKAWAEFWVNVRNYKGIPRTCERIPRPDTDEPAQKINDDEHKKIQKMD